MDNLAEHTPYIIALLGVGWSLAGFFLWKKLTRIENKTDQLLCLIQDTRENYVTKADFQHEIDQIWTAVNSHGHNGTTGRATR